MSNLVTESTKNRFQNIFDELENNNSSLPPGETIEDTEVVGIDIKLSEEINVDNANDNTYSEEGLTAISKESFLKQETTDCIEHKKQSRQPRYLGKLKVSKISLKTHEKEFAHWKAEARRQGTSLEEVIVDTCRQIFPW